MTTIHPLSSDELRVERYSDDGHFVVLAAMPGIDPATDLDVSVVEGALRIRAERRADAELEGRPGYRSDVRYGMFGRNVELPEGASDDDVDVEYHHGVLTIRVRLADDFELVA